MPEERGLYPGMRLGEQIEYFALLHDMIGPAARKAARDWRAHLAAAGVIVLFSSH
jgi:ABC-2 type transport system ATP-binding protein